MSSTPTLKRIDGKLTLTNGALTLSVDFSELLPRIKRGRLQQELLVKAAKLNSPRANGPSAIDATAGLGEDSFLLAAADFDVTLYEQNPTIAALLRDGLERATHDASTAVVASRMHLIEGDSIQALQSLTSAPDVIYLDPMFPDKTKAAATKKKFQLLHYLEAPCVNEAELLDAALSACAQKVVVKRPIKGAYLSELKPAYSLSGKAVRYDVYTPASMKL